MADRIEPEHHVIRRIEPPHAGTLVRIDRQASFLGADMCRQLRANVGS
jgi:hypothetical protein